MTEKNFDKIGFDRWYVRRDGNLIQLKEIGSYYDNGRVFEDREDWFDLIAEIEPPVIVPVKRKEKVTFYCYEDALGELHWKNLNNLDSLNLKWNPIPSLDKKDVEV